MNVDDINNLLSFIKESIDEMDDKQPAKASLVYLQNTKESIRTKALSSKRMGLIKLI